QAFQPLAAARPLFKAGVGDAFCSFDGRDDFLTITTPGHSSSNLTLFVLAAPRTNAGGFSALFSTTAAGNNDFTSGLNLDFGPAATKELSVLNVESAGSSGFRDLLEP